MTGAGSGIGSAIADRLAADGLDVLAVDLKPAEDGPGEPFEADLTTREGNLAAVDAALERFGGLDTIVANAGFQHVAPIAAFPEDRWDGLISLLLTSPFLLARYGWEALKQSGEGRFVAIASAHALAASPFKAGYVAAKHGVLGLVRAVAAELADAGVTVNAVCPGYADTPMTGHIVQAINGRTGRSEKDVRSLLARKQPIGRLITPEEVAKTILLCVTNGAITGQGINVDGGAIQS